MMENVEGSGNIAKGDSVIPLLHDAPAEHTKLIRAQTSDDNNAAIQGTGTLDHTSSADSKLLEDSNDDGKRVDKSNQVIEECSTLTQSINLDGTKVILSFTVISTQPPIDVGLISPMMCSPGLECLIEASQVVVHVENLRQNKIFDNDAVERLEVIDETRRVLFYAEREKNEDSQKSYMFHLFNSSGQEAIQIFNPLAQTCFCCNASWQWSKRCRFQATVFSPLGIIIGFVKQGHTMFVQEFQILSPSEDIMLVLRGGPSDLLLYSHDFQVEIGRLCIHGWHGIMHEVRRSDKDYGLTFPIDLDVRLKAVLIGALFSIHWLYSTEGGKSS